MCTRSVVPNKILILRQNTASWDQVVNSIFMLFTQPWFIVNFEIQNFIFEIVCTDFFSRAIIIIVIVIIIIIIIIIIILFYMDVSCHRPFLPGTSLEPAVIPTAQASSFTLQYFPHYVW